MDKFLRTTRTQEFCAFMTSKAAIGVSSRKLSPERSSNVGNCDCNIAGRNVRVLVDANVAVSKVNKALPCLVNVRRACAVIEFVECELVSTRKTS
jgi:hypothetical protein